MPGLPAIAPSGLPLVTAGGVPAICKVGGCCDGVTILGCQEFIGTQDRPYGLTAVGFNMVTDTVTTTITISASFKAFFFTSYRNVTVSKTIIGSPVQYSQGRAYMTFEIEGLNGFDAVDSQSNLDFFISVSGINPMDAIVVLSEGPQIDSIAWPNGSIGGAAMQLMYGLNLVPGTDYGLQLTSLLDGAPGTTDLSSFRIINQPKYMSCILSNIGDMNNVYFLTGGSSGAFFNNLNISGTWNYGCGTGQIARTYLPANMTGTVAGVSVKADLDPIESSGSNAFVSDLNGGWVFTPWNWGLETRVAFGSLVIGTGRISGLGANGDVVGYATVSYVMKQETSGGPYKMVDASILIAASFRYTNFGGRPAIGFGWQAVKNWTANTFSQGIVIDIDSQTSPNAEGLPVLHDMQYVAQIANTRGSMQPVGEYSIGGNVGVITDSSSASIALFA